MEQMEVVAREAINCSDPCAPPSRSAEARDYLAERRATERSLRTPMYAAASGCDGWLNGHCYKATALRGIAWRVHGVLARFERGHRDRRQRWRCFSVAALSNDTSAYRVGSRLYITLHDELTTELQKCLGIGSAASDGEELPEFLPSNI